MKLPIISIVIPTFNRANYLEKTISSVLNQNYPNLELIIVDGGSNDGSVEIIQKFKSQIAHFISEPDQGMYHALQKGFDKSSGDIMAWINSDDLYHHNSLHTVSKIFIDLPNLEWISGMPSFYNNNDDCVKISKPIYRTQEYFLIGDYNWIQQENVFWRRSIWEKSGSKLDLEYKLAGDFELWTRFFNFSQLYYVETSFAGFRLHGDQLSITKESQYEIEAQKIQYKNLKPGSISLRFKLLKYLFDFKSRLSKSQRTSMKLLAELITVYLNKKLKTKNHIYYDFTTNKWQC